MFSSLPSYLVAYHGTNRTIAERVVHGEGREHLVPTSNDYDWLGSGVYFWENSEERAREWAASRYPGEEVVIGAALQLGNCLDLLDQRCINLVEQAAIDMCDRYQAEGRPIPQNSPGGAHRFDCAVFDYIRADPSRTYGVYDSARAAYLEGRRIHRHSEFHRKAHVQIAVYNLDCIKGYFRPRKSTLLTALAGA